MNESSPPAALEHDEHHEGEKEVQLLARGHFAEFLDFETAFPEGGLLCEAHGGNVL